MKRGFGVYAHLLQEAVYEDSLRDKRKKIGPEKLLVHTTSVLSLLAHCAIERKKITYGEISQLTPSKPAQNANTSFGAIGLVLKKLSVENLFKASGQIPNVSSIVVQSGKEQGGKGVFLSAPDEALETAEASAAWLEKLQDSVFAYPRWQEVLAALGLRDLSNLSRSIAQDFARDGAGEQAAHRALKYFVCKNPQVIGLEAREGQTEVLLPSLDRIDVSFESDDQWVCAEVKPSSSLEGDLERGLFQVVKYQALLRACLLVRGDLKLVRCVLALGGQAPTAIKILASRLGIEIVEDIEMRMITL